MSRGGMRWLPDVFTESEDPIEKEQVGLIPLDIRRSPYAVIDLRHYEEMRPNGLITRKREPVPPRNGVRLPIDRAGNDFRSEVFCCPVLHDGWFSLIGECEEHNGE